MPPQNYLWRKVKRIYFPYVKWALFFLFIHNFLFAVNIYNSKYVSSIYSCRDFLMTALYIVFKMQGEEAMLGGFWFLKCLFFASLTLFLSLKWIRNRTIIIILFLTLMFGNLMFNIHIPFWGLGKTYSMAVIFMYLGYMYKEKSIQLECNSISLLVCFTIVCFGSLFWATSMLNFNLPKAVPYILSGVAGSIMILGISRKLNEKSTLTHNNTLYLGNKTMIILALHFISFKIVSLLIVLIYHLPSYRLAEFITIHEYSRKGWWIVYVLIGIACPLFMDYIYKNGLKVLFKK